MKKYISINQKNLIEIGKRAGIKVDAVDGILFDWIQNFTKSNKALKMIIDNNLYIWVSYKAIREDNPLCHINNNDVVSRRLNKLVQLGILSKYISKKDGNKSFFNITEFAFTYLLESRELPTQKSEPLPTQKSDNSKLDNRLLNSNKKYIKKQKSKFEVFIDEVEEIFKENKISTFKSKINKTKECKEYFEAFEDTNDIPSIYADYVARNRKMSVRLDKFLIAFLEGNLCDLEHNTQRANTKTSEVGSAVWMMEQIEEQSQPNFYGIIDTKETK